MPNYHCHQVKHLLSNFLASCWTLQHNSSSTPLAPPVFWPFTSPIFISPYFIFISLPTKQQLIIFLYTPCHHLPVIALEWENTKPEWIQKFTTPHSGENNTTINSQSLISLGLHCWNYIVNLLSHSSSLCYKSPLSSNPHSPIWPRKWSQILLKRKNRSHQIKRSPLSTAKSSYLLQFSATIAAWLWLLSPPFLEYLYRGLSLCFIFTPNISLSAGSLLKLTLDPISFLQLLSHFSNFL